MAQQRRVLSRGRGARRATEWGFLSETGVTTLAANSFLLWNSLSQASFGGAAPLTLVRTRGIITVFSDQVAATEMVHAVAGIAIVKEAARAAGTASLPDPGVGAADDGVWQMFQPLMARFTFLNATGVIGDNGRTYEIDSKSMRKIETGDALVLMLSNVSAAHGLTAVHNLRCLFKLH